MTEEARKDVARMGLKGVTLKKFEEIVADILLHCTPVYSPLPGLPDAWTRHRISSCILENPVFRAKHENDRRIFNNLCSRDDCDNKDRVVGKHDIEMPSEWPFDSLPFDARVISYTNGSSTRNNQTSTNVVESASDLPIMKATTTLHGMRAVRKEWQLKSLMQCVLSMLPPSIFEPLLSIEDEGCVQEKLRIVDFAGGTGHLSIPLAIMLPRVDVILVDLKRSSLDRAREKIESLMKMPTPTMNKDPSDDNRIKEQVIINRDAEMKSKDERYSDTVTVHDNVLEPTAIPNLYLYHGSISSFAKDHTDFDIGLGLHACGEATDLILRASGTVGANFIGKLNQTRRDPYIYHATARNEPTITYPQSSTFCKIIPQSGAQFDVLAKAADYSDWQDMRTCRNANRRTAKALVEMDRLLYMKETHGYDQVVLTKMDPWEASPKNDILMGWNHGHKKGLVSPYWKDVRASSNDALPTCNECNNDIKTSMDQLLCPPDEKNNRVHADWNMGDCNKVKQTLLKFAKGSGRIMRFPPGEGKHMRKLVHSIAEELNLRHWSEGKKNAEKIVVVG
eukprot:CAMPEP_0176501730 /NCGR_PEP_ID=MMETSP0200_2-20121128/14333_1 /TAXON_ID=947934 /ORGANISM="Chaetoceros sp., Strain GSL56" /LENGTH=563 /DNA_ID=CAMNT_0017900669 /DNA_START=901 /DNA_END=2588 /DNA_ORIENTATION=-